MCCFPANAGYSIDAKQNPSLRKEHMFGYVKWIIVFQLGIVYTYAAVAKIYGDWLDFGIIKILMLDKAGYYVIGDLLQQAWVHKIIGVFGILFDLLIVPALLWKPSRKIAFFSAVFFHLFNSIVFQIGIFPYLSIAFIVFFFEAESIRKIFFKNKLFYTEHKIEIPAFRNLALLLGCTYFLVQLALPLRHYFIDDAVLWTEEGHRLSWRMMLRSRSGKITFKVVNTETNASKTVKLSQYLTKKQRRRIAAYPDFIWQFAQYLKKEYAKKGETISVYALNSKIAVNGRPYRAFIDPKVDLAKEAWNHLEHHKWILPSQLKKAN